MGKVSRLNEIRIFENKLVKGSYHVHDKSVQPDTFLGVIHFKKGRLWYVAPMVEELLNELNIEYYDLLINAEFTIR